MYQGGINMGDGWAIDVRADQRGDAWINFCASGEAGSVVFTLGPASDELRELAGALMRCADAADETRQAYVRSNGNGGHARE